jgi:uncharacterized protein (DUF2147 family)
MTHFRHRTALLAVIPLILAGSAHAAEPIAGTWLTDDGEALIRIAPCGAAMCGKIAKILKQKPGSRMVDGANPDPQLRSRPIVGTAILTDLVDAGALWKGRIYNPDTGKSYAAKVQRTSAGALKVEGCVAFLCKGPTWQPVR